MDGPVATITDKPVPPPASRKRLSSWIAISGMLSLSFLLGASVIYFRLPPAQFLRNAFEGARAWSERQPTALGAWDPEPAPTVTGKTDLIGKTCDGFTLYATASLSKVNTRAYLMNMSGEVVYRWVVSFSKLWPDPTQGQAPPDDTLVAFNACHVYPNGDLLVVFHSMTQDGSRGCGLAKFDKDSQVLWKFDAAFHHDVDVGEDGTIYALRESLISEMPKGLEFIPAPAQVDSLVILSSDGKVLKSIPILEAFRDSQYAALLTSVELPSTRRIATAGAARHMVDSSQFRGDPLHTNSVKVLNGDLASRFPAFRRGQVLISVRNLDAIAMLDPESEKIVWAACGPWLGQHDAQFLANGHLLIFDNLGAPRGSRVLEYDPQTQALPWSYSGENAEPFFTGERGLCQRLPNGNTLIVSSEGRELREVTKDQEVVWSYLFDNFISTARRYTPDQVGFLKEDQRARP
jgi:hypothetical protein